MKNLNFVDSDYAVFSKQEILAALKEKFSLSTEIIEWLDSITNDVALTHYEAKKVYASGSFYYAEDDDNRKLALLFDPMFFHVEEDISKNLKRFFRTELLDDERIKSIPLLFTKNKGINFSYGIMDNCARNKEFAEAFKAEIWNNNESLGERLTLLFGFGCTNELIKEFFQPAFEMLSEYLNCDTISGNCALDLLLISMLETPDGIQIPRWNEENYLCRLLLDCVIMSHESNTGILDKLFRDYTITDTVQIICDHFKWRKDNMPQFPVRKSKDYVKYQKHHSKYAGFLEAQLLELFNGDIPYIYSNLLYNHFFSGAKKDAYSTLDNVQSSVCEFLFIYLAEKIALAIGENNHEQMRNISHLLDNEIKDMLKRIKHKELENEIKCLEHFISCVMGILGSDDRAAKSIELIFEIFLTSGGLSSYRLDIFKKCSQVQQLVFEHCYTILKGSWDTLFCTPIFFRKIQAHVPAVIIGKYKGIWYGLKPLLITLRKTRMEWVDASLNIIAGDFDHFYWNEIKHSNLVLEIEFYLNFFEKSSKSLRQDMADGLSDWLKPLQESKRGDLEKRLAEFPEIEKDREGFDITYTEPDPVWRYAYVRAIADLGVDVDGKGHYIHSVMDKVVKEDPSQMVRKAAEKASERLKKLRNGWDGDNHFEKITMAFWWFKQASRLALNLPVDKLGSLNTRGVYKSISLADAEFGVDQNERKKIIYLNRTKCGYYKYGLLV